MCSTRNYPYLAAKRVRPEGVTINLSPRAETEPFSPDQRMTQFRVLTATLLFALIVQGCSDDDLSERSDSGGELQTASEQEPDADPQAAEIDAIIDQYYRASDSLASLFETIGTVADAEAAGPEIERLNQEIWEFNRLSVQYGTPLMERMNASEDDGALNRLFLAREKLLENAEAYAVVQEFESKTEEQVPATTGEE